MSFWKQFGVLCLMGATGAGLWLSGVELPFGREKPAASATAASRPAPEPAPVLVDAVRFQSAAAVVEAVGTGDALRAVTLHPEAAGRVTAVLFEAGQAVAAGEPLLELDSDDERLALELSQVRVQEARQQLRRYESAAPSGAVASGEVDTARTSLSAARIEVAQAELALARRTLRAPFDGVLGIPEVEVGDRVDESTAVATLDDRSVVLVDFEVPESFAYGVEVGKPVDATTWALPGDHFQGTVDATASRIDPQTRTLRVRAGIPNEDGRLRTGMSFVIRLELAGERFPSVPSIAVLWDRTGAYVWRVDAEGSAERVNVDVLKREDQWILVDAPLAEGDRVVVEGVQRLRPGREVTIVERDTVSGGGQGV